MTLDIDTRASLGWYDVTIRIDGHEPFHRQYAGRIETGHWGFSDPAMGRVIGQTLALHQPHAAK